MEWIILHWKAILFFYHNMRYFVIVLNILRLPNSSIDTCLLKLTFVVCKLLPAILFDMGTAPFQVPYYTIVHLYLKDCHGPTIFVPFLIFMYSFLLHIRTIWYHIFSMQINSFPACNELYLTCYQYWVVYKHNDTQP